MKHAVWFPLLVAACRAIRFEGPMATKVPPFDLQGVSPRPTPPPSAAELRVRQQNVYAPTGVYYAPDGDCGYVAGNISDAINFCDTSSSCGYSQVPGATADVYCCNPSNLNCNRRNPWSTCYDKATDISSCNSNIDCANDAGVLRCIPSGTTTYYCNSATVPDVSAFFVYCDQPPSSNLFLTLLTTYINELNGALVPLITSTTSFSTSTSTMTTSTAISSTATTTTSSSSPTLVPASNSTPVGAIVGGVVGGVAAIIIVILVTWFLVRRSRKKETAAAAAAAAAGAGGAGAHTGGPGMAQHNGNNPQQYSAYNYGAASPYQQENWTQQGKHSSVAASTPMMGYADNRSSYAPPQAYETQQQQQSQQYETHSPPLHQSPPQGYQTYNPPTSNQSQLPPPQPQQYLPYRADNASPNPEAHAVAGLAPPSPQITHDANTSPPSNRESVVSPRSTYTGTDPPEGPLTSANNAGPIPSHYALPGLHEVD